LLKDITVAIPLATLENKMATLSALKLVTSKKQSTANPIINRRLKLLSKIQEQIELCIAKKEGNTYAPKRLKSVTDKETGERKTIESLKRVKEWFWINETGKIHLAIKYGSKTLMLNKKGANAIEVNNGDELISTLKHIAGSIENGELDEFINDVSKATRDSFAK
jgi:hypothetical protein